MSPNEILHALRRDFRVNLTKAWIQAFLGRYLDELHVCRVSPEEDAQLIVPRVYLAGKLAELVFNLDEIGSPDWEERRSRKGMHLGPSYRTMHVIQSLAAPAI
jgi:hypothetical protein